MVGGIMSDVFYEMSKVTMKPVVNYVYSPTDFLD